MYFPTAAAIPTGGVTGSRSVLGEFLKNRAAVDHWLRSLLLKVPATAHASRMAPPPPCARQNARSLTCVLKARPGSAFRRYLNGIDRVIAGAALSELIQAGLHNPFTGTTLGV
jgi:hypothetical protein